MINFKVPRTKDCVIIDTKNWLQNSSQILTIHRMSGRDIPTFLAKAVEVNNSNECFNGVIEKGDTLFLTRVVSEVAQCRPFEVEVGDKRYYDVPIMQVIGKFNDGNVSYDSLQLLFDKVLIKKIDTSKVGYLEIPNSNTMIGEVVKTGTCAFDKEWNKKELVVKNGDIVLIKDNVSTEITFGTDTYYASEESAIVGIFNGVKEYTLENLTLINDNILLESYIPEIILSSSLSTPTLNFEEEDVTDIYNRDLFKIVAIDKSLTNLKKDDIILTDRSVTNYAYIGVDKYFLLTGTTYLEAKVKV